VALDSKIHSGIQPHGAGSAVIWSSDSSPAVVDTNSDHALAATEFVNNGSIFRVVDVPPRTVGLLHRSLSLDYIIVQHGSITLTLDSGTRTKVHPGEFVIQQATMHGWDNDSDEWVRLIAIMLPARAPRVGDRELGTDLSALFGPGS
jgi:quercetin dioxygenase-like cupin family protein